MNKFRFCLLAVLLPLLLLSGCSKNPLFSILPTPKGASSGTSDGTLIYSQSFSTLPLGAFTSLKDWYIIPGTGIYSIDSFGFDDNRSLKVNTNYFGGPCQLTFSSTKLARVTAKYNIYLQDGADFSLPFIPCSSVTIDVISNKLYFGLTQLGSITPAVWHEVKNVYDQSAGVWSFYIDGSIIKTQALSDGPGTDTFYVVMGTGTSITGKCIYFDNLNIYQN